MQEARSIVAEDMKRLEQKDYFAEQCERKELTLSISAYLKELAGFEDFDDFRGFISGHEAHIFQCQVCNFLWHGDKINGNAPKVKLAVDILRGLKITRQELNLLRFEISHGQCSVCMQDCKDLFRKRQRNQGYNDCFAKATEPCSRKECIYHKVCYVDVNFVKAREFWLNAKGWLR